MLCDSANKGIDLSDERLTALAKKVQECFPVMRMRYANGTDSPFYFRCNKTEIKNKLKKFLTVYGDVADDDIIDATKRYVATYASKGYHGMRLAKYFILKEDRKLMADTTSVRSIDDIKIVAYLFCVCYLLISFSLYFIWNSDKICRACFQIMTIKITYSSPTKFNLCKRIYTMAIIIR